MPECGPDEPGGRPSDPVDTIFAVLASSERRCTIRLLQSLDEPIAVADLAQELSVLDRMPLDASDGIDSVQRLQTLLFHVHLPKLADADAIEFDQQRNTVAPGEHFERFATALRLLDDFPSDDE